MYFDKATLTQKSSCRNCGVEIDAHTSNNGDTPKKDDISICGACGEISKFDENLNLLPMDGEEIKQLKHNDPSTYWELKKLSLWIKTKINNGSKI